jgi:hypothetical protein
MIRRLIEWAKSHKLTAALGIIVGYFVLQWAWDTPIVYNLRYPPGQPYNNTEYMGVSPPMTPMTYDSAGYSDKQAIGQSDSYVGDTANIKVDVTTRMTTKNYNISSVVEDVKVVTDAISSLAPKHDGYIVSSSLNNYNDKTSSYLSVRIPSIQASEFLAEVKKLSVKVVNENVYGEDITDQYTDVEENLRLLTDTKVRFEEIWKSATKTQDMLSVLREIQNIQREIDALKGKKMYLENLSKYSLFTLNFSKDEMDLPYMPSESWSAEYVFRSAVRELIRNVRGIAGAAIWLAVFAVIWVPVLIAGFFVYRRWGKQIVG